MSAVDDGKKLADAWAASGMFGKSPEEAAATRVACSQGERCTLCGAPAAFKVEEDTFGEHRHPLTAYICEDHHARLMSPYKFKDEVGHWMAGAVEPRPQENAEDNAAAGELARMLDALQRSSNVGLFGLGRYQAQKRLINGYEVTFEVRDAKGQSRSDWPEVVCPGCGACFCGDDEAELEDITHCPECNKQLVCVEKSVVWTWSVDTDTEPPASEKTNPVASPAPMRDEPCGDGSRVIGYEVADEDGAEEPG